MMWAARLDGRLTFPKLDFKIFERRADVTNVGHG